MQFTISKIGNQLTHNVGDVAPRGLRYAGQHRVIALADFGSHIEKVVGHYSAPQVRAKGLAIDRAASDRVDGFCHVGRRLLAADLVVRNQRLVRPLTRVEDQLSERCLRQPLFLSIGFDVHGR